MPDHPAPPDTTDSDAQRRATTRRAVSGIDRERRSADTAGDRAQRATKGVLARHARRSSSGKRTRRLTSGQRRGAAAAVGKAAETPSPSGGVQVFRAEVRNGIDPALLKHIQGLSRPDTVTDMDEPAVYLAGDPAAARAALTEALEARKGVPGKKPIPCVEMVFAGPPKYGPHQWSREKEMEWARAVVAWVEKTLGPRSVIAAAYLHRDESSPHVHVLATVVCDNGKLGWFSRMKEIGPRLGARSSHVSLCGSAVQDSLHKDVGAGYGFHRGELKRLSRDPRRHKRTDRSKALENRIERADFAVRERVADGHEEMDELVVEAVHLRHENARLAADIETRKAETEALKADKAALEAGNEVLRKAILTAVEKADARTRAAQEKVAESEEKSRRLADENERLAGDNAALLDEKTKLEEQAQAQRRELEDLSADTVLQQSEAERVLAEKQAKAQATEDAAQGAEQRKRRAEAELQEVGERVDAKRSELSEVQASVVRDEALKAAAHEALGAVQTALADTQTALADTREKVEAQEQSLAHAREECRSAEASRDAARKQKHDDEALAGVAGLRSRRGRELREGYLSRIAGLETENATLTERIGVLEEQSRGLTETLATTAAERDTAIEQRDEAHTQLSESGEQHAKELDTLRTESADALQAAKDRHKKELREARSSGKTALDEANKAHAAQVKKIHQGHADTVRYALDLQTNSEFVDAALKEYNQRMAEAEVEGAKLFAVKTRVMIQKRSPETLAWSPLAELLDRGARGVEPLRPPEEAAPVPAKGRAAPPAARSAPER